MLQMPPNCASCSKWAVRRKSLFIMLCMLFSTNARKKELSRYNARASSMRPSLSSHSNAVPKPKNPGTFCLSWVHDPTNGMARKSPKVSGPSLARLEGRLPMLVSP